ncbi:UDP-N-acetylglucosamine 1-carboxyvinyltransferase [Enterococcus faecium]
MSGAKNSAVALIPAAILADSPVILEGVPDIQDVHSLIEILEIMGATVHFSNNILEIDPREIVSIPMPHGKINSLRASYYFMGTLLGKFGEAVVGLPGGCYLGPRPIDLHVKGFEALGAEVTNEHGAMYLRTENKGLRGNRIFMDVVSVGATINVMLAAVKAKGTTIIENVAREPEIVDLANILNKMGAQVYGAGTETMRIEGVDHLHAVNHSIVQDRIEAGTFMVAAAMTQGNVLIADAISEHNRPLISKLIEMGAEIIEEEGGVRVIGPKHILPTDVKTMPHPGFPTDMQAQMTAIQLVAEGTSVVTETVFENRFQHLEEMRRMNAHVKIDGNVAIMDGNHELQGAEVYATDLRAAAALVLAGLKANGITRVRNLNYLDRGYYNFHIKLQQLGADVERVDMDQTSAEKTAQTIA